MSRAVFHPVAIAAVLLLALNDHVLKRAYPGLVTGKLSDVAGMIFFPLLLHALVPGAGRRALVVSCVATAIVFALVKTSPFANDAYRVVWGLMQAPFRGHFARVVLVRDPSDLVAVPFVALAYRIGVAAEVTEARRPPRSRSRSRSGTRTVTARIRLRGRAFLRRAA